MKLEAHCDHRISYHHTNFILQVHSNTVLTIVEVSFILNNGINYKSHAKVLCTFKLNSQCHDSIVYL